MSLKEKILTQLQQNSYTPLELSSILHTPKSTIRARISELRKSGYHISKSPYTLDNTPHNFESLMTKHSLWNKPLPINFLCTHLNMSRSEVENFLAKHFSTYDITQLSKNTLTIKQKI